MTDAEKVAAALGLRCSYISGKGSGKIWKDSGGEPLYWGGDQFVYDEEIAAYLDSAEGQQQIRDRVEELAAQRMLFIRETKHPSGGRLLELYASEIKNGLVVMTDDCKWFICNGTPAAMTAAALIWLDERREK